MHFGVLCSVCEETGALLCEVLMLQSMCIFTTVPPSATVPTFILSVSPSQEQQESRYYYSSVFAAVVTMATAGVRQRF